MTVNAVAFDIVTLLDTNFPSLTTGTNLFGQEWGHVDGQDVDAQICVIDGEPIASPLKQQYEQPVFQVLSRGGRGQNSLTAYNTLRAVHEFLIQQPELIAVNGCEYVGFEPQGGIAPLGRDDNDRMVYSIRYYTFRNPISN